MTDTLTQLIARVQGSLLDDGTRYTTATCTHAIRQALKEFNKAAPYNTDALLDTYANQLIYELGGNPDFSGLLAILGVWRNDSNEVETPLDYQPYWAGNSPAIRLTYPQPEVTAGVIVRFTTPNYISGLDSAAESTIPSYYDQVIVDGAAYYAICIRSAGRVEPINLNRDVSANLREAAAAYKLAFDSGLTEAGRMKPRARENTGWVYEPKGY